MRCWSQSRERAALLASCASALGLRNRNQPETNMKTRTRRRPAPPQAGAALARAALLAGLWLCAAAGHAQTILNYWPFNDADWSFTSTNWLNDWHGHPPGSFFHPHPQPPARGGAAPRAARRAP